MRSRLSRSSLPQVLLVVSFAAAVVIGVTLGLALALNRNAALSEQFEEFRPALPTQVLDIHDRPITEFFGDQKRELVTIDEVPPYLIDALLTREDQHFFTHHGFDLRAMGRAAWNIVTRNYISGASTITQQLAGRLAGIRSDMSVHRKLVELWDSIQMERRYSKWEILQRYVNEMPFGSNTQGVQAASQFYFHHDVQDDTLAECSMLAILLASPSLNNPITNPDRAKTLQRYNLDQMVKLGYVTQKQADDSFDQFWLNWDPTRPDTTAYFDRADKAPYFSEYIRGQLGDILYGSYNPLTDGLVVHTTLNLDYQRIAEERMSKDIPQVNELYQEQNAGRDAAAVAAFEPVVDLLGSAFNIDGLLDRNRSAAGNAARDYATRTAPMVEMASTLFSLPRSEEIVSAGIHSIIGVERRNEVQGALVTIDSRTGYILAMVGGRKFGVDQFNRVVSGAMEPGSAFKPLYYSAAIDSRKFTPATMILDRPVVFTNPDGTPYEPQNFLGEWHGRVLLRDALADSMNVPSLEILDGIGFDAAIQRASRMLGVTDPAEIERRFPRYYPLGLGAITVSPLEMVRAYATFANQGREVVPVSIRYIEDRDGKIIAQPAQDAMAAEDRQGSGAQIMSPQTAYIMTSLLQSTLKDGTLTIAGGILDIWNDTAQPFAGKTGTSQNWRDAWVVGYSPYVTTAVWYGFDRGSRSLGVGLTGATIAAPTWAKYMRDIHKGLPVEQFPVPETGLVWEDVSATSGLLPSEDTQRTIREVFLAGTEPTTFDTLDAYDQARAHTILNNLRGWISANGSTDGDVLPPLDSGGNGGSG